MNDINFATEQNVVIVVNPQMTCLFEGQLISIDSLPSLLEHNFTTLDEIEVTPYTKQRHLNIIDNPTIKYPHLKRKDFFEIY